MATFHLDRKKKLGKVYFVLVVVVNGQRQRRGIGYDLEAKVTRRLETIATSLENIKMVGETPNASLQQDVNTLNDELISWFVEIGLIQSPIPLLEDFFADYVSLRSSLAPNTLKKMENSYAFFVGFVGNRKLSDVSKGSVVKYIEHRRSIGKAEQTIKTEVKHCGWAFGHAVDLHMVTVNPFSNHSFDKTTVREAVEVDANTLSKVISSIDNDDWLASVSICRWTGCRLSEAFKLQWKNIDWVKNWILLYSKKTAKKGKSIRHTVMAPELRSILEGLWERSPKGSEYVIGKKFAEAAKTVTHTKNGKEVLRWGKNLRAPFRKLIEKAGFEPWPSPFQSLRVTRENELVKLGIPLHVACGMMGNTESIARAAYLRTRDADLDSASEKILGGQIVGSMPKQTHATKAELETKTAAKPGFPDLAAACIEGLNALAPRIDPDIGPSLRSRFRKWSKKQGLQSSRPDRLVVLSVPRYGKVA